MSPDASGNVRFSIHRTEKETVDSGELVWHQDQEDRIVKVIKSNGWRLQMDNELPVTLQEGKKYYISAYEFHRIIKGSGDLIVEITKKR
jgi:O-methyltransferase involved in polyketide biosynthesis